MSFWLLILVIFGVTAALFYISQTFHYFFKMTLYVLSICVGCTLGALICLPNGRTTKNHFVMFDVFQRFVSWTGMQVTVEHKERLISDESFIIVANHQSCLDVHTMTFVWPENCVVMLKNTLRYLPGFNLCAYLCDSIYIDRFRKEKAHQSVESALQAIREHKRKIFIYPEGTRNDAAEFLPFKKGAFILAKTAGVPVVPVVFSTYQGFYNSDERRFEQDGRVVAHVLEPIPADAFESVDELSDECRRRMTAAYADVNARLTQKKHA